MGVRLVRAWMGWAAVVALVLVALTPPMASPQEAEGGQDDESKALDSTATQWSFQFAWQGMDYQEDMLSDGSTRPAGDCYLPIGLRAGWVNVTDKGSWNFYGEYQTAAIYSDYPGPAVKNSVRVNVTYTIPVG